MSAPPTRQYLLAECDRLLDRLERGWDFLALLERERRWEEHARWFPEWERVLAEYIRIDSQLQTRGVR